MMRLAVRTGLVLYWLICGVLTAQTTPAAEAPADFVVENQQAGEQLFPWGTGRMATFEDLSGFLYRSESGKDWLNLQDSTGNEAHIRLPDRFERNDRANAEYVLSGRHDLWLWSGVFGASRLRHYRLLGSGTIPDRAALVSSTPIGDQNTRPGALISLASGGVVGIWYQYEYHRDRHIDMGLIYVSPQRKIYTIFPLRGEGRGGTAIASRWTLVQHPADGSIWAFYKRDSYHEISAVHLTETASGIRVDWIDPGFIDRQDGIHAPEGEYPYLAAAPDVRQNTIRLAYQNKNYETFYVADDNGVFIRGSCENPGRGKLDPALFTKGAYISIAQIDADRSKSFILFPTYVEATRYFGFSVNQRLWLAFQPIGCENMSYSSLQRGGNVYLSHFEESWSPPVMIGHWDDRKDYYSSPILYNVTRPEFVLRLDDKRVHDFEGF